jgi:hypothetical protein
VTAGLHPSLRFPDQFFCLFVYFTANASGETLHQSPSIGQCRFSLSGDVLVDMQLLDAIPSENFPTQRT